MVEVTIKSNYTEDDTQVLYVSDKLFLEEAVRDEEVGVNKNGLTVYRRVTDYDNVIWTYTGRRVR